MEAGPNLHWAVKFYSFLNLISPDWKLCLLSLLYPWAKAVLDKYCILLVFSLTIILFKIFLINNKCQLLHMVVHFVQVYNMEILMTFCIHTFYYVWETCNKLSWYNHTLLLTVFSIHFEILPLKPYILKIVGVCLLFWFRAMSFNHYAVQYFYLTLLISVALRHIWHWYSHSSWVRDVYCVFLQLLLW